jgi:ABC-type dipeptide/oligopeptide/nickel transport system permease subunit
VIDGVAAVAPTAIAHPHAPAPAGWRDRARGHGAFLTGLAIFALLAVVSILAPVLAPFDPTAIHASDGLKPPSPPYLLGTDNLGRDILSRIIYAARTSLLVALGSVLVAGVIGVPLGLIAGYAGGKIDSVIMRILDAILAFPVILLAILVVATLGTETINLILTIGFVFIPYFTRLVRGNVLALKEREFVTASRASGADDGYLVSRVILPNILSPVVVQASLTMSLAVLIEAALSFLGLGVQEPTPAWGSMLQQSQLYLRQAPWFVLSPGICIFLAVLAFNLIGDGLRDLLDVSARRR